VTNKESGGLAGSEIPESEGLVPRGGEGEVVFAGEGDIGNEVVVAGELLEWVTVEGVGGDVNFIGFGTFELPDHDRLVTGTGDEDI